MSKAIELAKECGLLSDTVHMYADEVETFFRRAQAIACAQAYRHAAGLFSEHVTVTELRRMADELEAGNEV